MCSSDLSVAIISGMIHEDDT